MKKAITASKGAKPAGQYSHAIVANGFVFVSGQGPVNPATGVMPDNFAEQVRQTLKNIQTILEAAGTSLENVVKVNTYLVDLTRFEEYNTVYKEFFPHEPPARTTVATGLKGILVEIDCIAALP
jgi:2-iminobutanoate/2-iminopropanoate deaminase